MPIFEDVSEFFSKVKQDDLNSVEKVQYIEDILREGLRDLAYSRDEIYRQALQEKTVFMVRPGEEKYKKFTSGEQMYISLPAEKLYDEIKDIGDFDQYHKIMDAAMLTMAAEEYRETSEEGDVNVIEAELIDKAVKKVEDFTGDLLPIADDIIRDDFEQPKEMKDSKEYFEPKKFSKIKADGSEEEDEDDKAAKDADSGEEGTGTSTSGTVEMQQIDDDVDQEAKDTATAMEQTYQASYAAQSITETEQKQVDDIKSSRFHAGRYGEEDSILTPKVKFELDRTIKDIAKALQGYDGKIKRSNPAKRLSSKDICNDISDKIYVGKNYTDGKFIDQNIVVDCSGSMNGDPIRDAVKLCYVFNKLAQQDLLEGAIVLTESSENKYLKMPVHDDLIDIIGGTGGGEGLTKTLVQYKKELRGKNVIVMTDGDLN